MRAIVVLSFCIFLSLGVFSVAAQDTAKGSVIFKRVADERWVLSYCFDRPIELFGFERPIPNMRQTHWRALGSDLVLQTTEEDTAFVKRRDGQRFTCADIEVKTYTELPPKNYYAFSSYSDGGVSIYTGFFTGSVFEGGQRIPTTLEAKYIPRDGERVFGYDLDILEHQFVYFGPQAVIETGSAILVVDPQMPTLVRDRVLAAFDKANALLDDLFGYKHEKPYMVFMAAGELYTYQGTSMKGGTRPGQIRFTFKGEGSAKIAETDPNYYPKFALHEMLHIWQEDTWHDQLGEDRPWIHEGSADALAYEMMLEAGLYTQAEYEAVWKAVENQCSSLLQKTSIHGGPDVGEFNIVYQCGAFVNYLIGAALNAENPGEGLIHFWRAMAGWDRETIATKPSEALLFDTLIKLNVGPEKIQALQDFLAIEPDDPAQAVATVKEQFGLVP